MTINVLSPVPPTCENEIFVCGTSYVHDKYDIYTYTTLHVPIGSKEYYSSAYEWRYFAKIKEDMQMDGQAYYTTLSVYQGDMGFVQHYVKADDSYTVFIGSEGQNKVNTVLFNGQDVTDQLVDGYYTTPAMTTASVLRISYETTQSLASVQCSIKVYGHDGMLYIDGLDEAALCQIFTAEGKMVQSEMLTGYGQYMLQEGAYVVRVGERTFKVAL